MGEIADMMINGDMDFFTGEYMGRGKGFPRTFDKSLPWEKKRCSPISGINGFCYSRGKNRSSTNKIIKRYAKEVLNIEVPKGTSDNYKAVVFPVLNRAAIEIQKDFDAFYKWFNEKYGKESQRPPSKNQ